MDYYCTMSLADKISLLTQLQRSQALGQVKSQEGGGRVRTEFDVTDSTTEREIVKLMDSIREDPGFTSDNPLYDAIMAQARPGQTIPIYVSTCGNGYGL
jgi:hypothetical protein